MGTYVICQLLVAGTSQCCL